MGDMREEAIEKLEKEKAEVTETFCGRLKDKQKDKCVQFCEELADMKQSKKDPDEKRKK